MLTAFMVVIWREDIKFQRDPKWKGLYSIVTMDNHKSKNWRATCQAAYNKYSELD